ncbi:amidophosphoribosyltransferase [bacterium]|nr:amidophosphoribosyltransferase [bacterium]
MKEYCGVCGIIGRVENIYKKMYLSLFSLQHRGQESCGITVDFNDHFYTYKAEGFVSNLKNIREHVEEGASAIGHVRYKTAGDSSMVNAQPIYVKTHFGNISLAHNGNLINLESIKRDLIKKGAIFQGNSDSEVILHHIAHQSGDFLDALKNTLKSIKGAFSLVLLTDEALYGIRDPFGYRPLVYGEVEGGTVISSETCSIELLNGKYINEISPGTILRIDKSGKKEFIKFDNNKLLQQCVFEHIYFARPDSTIFGHNVHQMRYKMGEQLAREYKGIAADLVVAVPDSGFSAALGFAKESGIKLDRGLIRNHYVGRSFIQPTIEERKNIIRMKLRPILEVIKGKSIALLDDSIVRGTTAREIILLLKKYKVKKIHFFITAPPIKYSCYFGIDTPTRDELIANRFNPAEMAKFFGIESVNYLSVEGLKTVFNGEEDKYCYACFNGSYPKEFKDDGLL